MTTPRTPLWNTTNNLTNAWIDYEQICLRDPDWQPQYAATGNGIAIMANRISYAFNFHGPSVTLDTGCSASLVSVHLAAQSLRNGESSLVTHALSSTFSSISCTDKVVGHCRRSRHDPHAQHHHAHDCPQLLEP